MHRESLPYFGSCLLWQKALTSGGVAFRRNENYQRRSQRNRTVIANSSGPQTLSIPLHGGKHQNCPISSVTISYAENWQRQHWLSLTAAYGKAPFWAEYHDELKLIVCRTEVYLWDYNWATVEWVKSVVVPQLVLAKAEDWIPAVDGPSTSLKPTNQLRSYPQLFSDRLGWLSNLSILDLIFCQGPAASSYLAID